MALVIYFCDCIELYGIGIMAVPLLQKLPMPNSLRNNSIGINESILTHLSSMAGVTRDTTTVITTVIAMSIIAK